MVSYVNEEAIEEAIEEALTDTQTEGPEFGRGKEHEFLAIEGMTVVGIIMADCAECGWEKIFIAYPDARLACFCGEYDGKGCIHQRKPQGRWVPFD